MTLDADDSLPIEEFIQALTSQLDRAQRTLALKAKAGLPLTFAVKTMDVDLRAHLTMVNGRVLMRSAGPNDVGASVMRIAFTTITRPMIEENTVEMEADDVPLDEALGDDVSEEERRRLEWAGVHTVSQLRELERGNGRQALEQLVQIPAMRLRQALERAARPVVRRVISEPVAPGETPTLRIRGVNLRGLDAGSRLPRVRIAGEPADVLRATDRELLVAARPHQLAGELEVEAAPGLATTFAFDATAAPTAPGDGARPSVLPPSSTGPSR